MHTNRIVRSTPVAQVSFVPQQPVHVSTVPYGQPSVHSGAYGQTQFYYNFQPQICESSYIQYTPISSAGAAVAFGQSLPPSFLYGPSSVAVYPFSSNMVPCTSRFLNTLLLGAYSSRSHNFSRRFLRAPPLLL